MYWHRVQRDGAGSNKIPERGVRKGHHVDTGARDGCVVARFLAACPTIGPGLVLAARQLTQNIEIR